MRLFWDCEKCSEEFGAPVGVQVNLAPKYIARSLKMIQEFEQKHAHCCPELPEPKISFDQAIEWWEAHKEHIHTVTREEFLNGLKEFIHDQDVKIPEYVTQPPPSEIEPVSLECPPDSQDPLEPEKELPDFW